MPVSAATGNLFAANISYWPSSAIGFGIRWDSWGGYFRHFYTQTVTAAELKEAEKRYSRETTVSGVKNFFNDFAAASMVAGGVQSCSAVDKIGASFDIYQFPGKPLLETSSSKPNLPGLINTATTSDNRSIDWNVGVVSETCTLTLNYFVQANTENAVPGNYYPTNEYAYVVYEALNGAAAGTGYAIYFAHPYVNIVAGEVKNPEEPERAAATATPTPSSGGLLPAVVARYGPTPEVYTPSVTPNARSIENESLQEDTVSVPVTGDTVRPPYILALFGLIAAALAASIAGWQARKNGRS